MDIDAVMAFVDGLEGTTIVPHHERLAARTKRRIYVTWPRDGATVNVLGVDAEGPGIAPLWWGRQRSGVTVTLAEADEAQVRALIAEAWRR